MPTSDTIDVDAYLKRIGYSGSREPNAQTLDALHRAHLLSVPFENLNIHNGLPISLDTPALFRKIVEERRGGFCYELNGLFSRLLVALGFDVTLLSAGVFRTTNDFGPEYDHLTLLVQLEERWIADVGFGASFRHPLRLDLRAVQVQENESFKFVDKPGYVILHRQKRDAEWKPAYRFTLKPRTYDEFFEMCVFHSTSHESPFLKRSLIMMETSEGRIELMDRTFALVLLDGTREEKQLDEDAYVTVLRDKFGVVMPPRR